jgi:hypothetical protein
MFFISHVGRVIDDESLLLRLPGKAVHRATLRMIWVLHFLNSSECSHVIIVALRLPGLAVIFL